MNVEIRQCYPEKIGVAKTLYNKDLHALYGDQLKNYENMAKKEMAYKIADELLELGFFKFSSCSRSLDGIYNDYQVVRAELNVVRPE